VYIVTKNNPYYPSVEYCSTFEEANRIAQEFIDELYIKDGEYEWQVTIAEVLNTRSVTSY